MRLASHHVGIVRDESQSTEIEARAAEAAEAGNILARPVQEPVTSHDDHTHHTYV